jgi:YHS domain-containing protein
MNKLTRMLKKYTKIAIAATVVLGAPVASADSYPLDTCPVTGEKLGSMGEPIVKNYDGREIRFCCAGCPKKFESDLAGSLAKVDEAIVKQQSPYYPLTTCAVSGAKLGSMGDPIEMVYQNRLVRLCCEGCIKKVEADPAKYLAIVDEAVIAQQQKTYPLKTCVVSGEALGSMGDPIERVFANRLVRLCCKGCVKDFEKDPVKFLSKLDEASPGGAAKSGAHDHGDHKH